MLASVGMEVEEEVEAGLDEEVVAVFVGWFVLPEGSAVTVACEVEEEVG